MLATKLYAGCEGFSPVRLHSLSQRRNFLHVVDSSSVYARALLMLFGLWSSILAVFCDGFRAALTASLAGFNLPAAVSDHDVMLLRSASSLPLPTQSSCSRPPIITANERHPIPVGGEVM